MARSRSKSRDNDGRRTHKRKSRDDESDRKRTRSRSRSRSRERRKRREREDSSDRKRARRREDDTRSSKHDSRSNGAAAPPASDQSDILKRLAASISARVVQQETAQIEAVERVLDGRDESTAAATTSPPAAAAAGAPHPSAASATTASAPISTAAAAAATAEEAQRKRKERLKEWQAQQLAVQRKTAAEQAEADARAKAVAAVGRSPAAGTGVSTSTSVARMSLGAPKGKGIKGKSKTIAFKKAPVLHSKSQFDDLSDDDEEDDNTFYSLDSQGRPLPRARGSSSVDANDPTAAAAAPMEQDEEVDPLDAYMSGVHASKDIVVQDTMSTAFGIGDGSRSTVPASAAAAENSLYDEAPAAPAITSISLEEILSMGRAGADNWESDVAQSDADEAPRGAGSTLQLDDDDESAPVVDAAAEEQAKMAASREKQRESEELRLHSMREQESAAATARSNSESLGRMWADEGDIVEEAERQGQSKKDALTLLAEQTKKKELKPVDHSTITYKGIRKNLFIVPRALQELSKQPEELQRMRAKLEIKIRGTSCPPLVDTWDQCGLSDRMLAVIKNAGFAAPFAIQRQAVPALMSGRDVIGVARTGSGKTLAFLLPMFRHVLDQEPLAEGEGPIGIIMAPARELAVQIHSEARKFAKAVGLRVVAVYGGAGIKDQIGELKRGADIVVCTPGRMIDILTMQAGKLVSLKRVSFVVMDEADRMFDMGFEPQIKMILQNVRPDRQTALFSATFPTKVEDLARKVLLHPLEIVVGGRSVASEAIAQHVEVREEDDKYMRLLQLLGLWYERGNVLIFVDSQQKVDSLYSDLTRSGYAALSLHGGKEQDDRDGAIQDFKKKIRTLMVATSVAGRGLDVPDLVCVINYSCPNHLEDYVHRVGRTGRAGRSGTAYTFISPEEEQHAPTLVKALQQAKQTVPQELRDMADAFTTKVAAGQARKANSGFSGKGFTFDDSEMTQEQKIRAQEKRQYEIETGMRDATENLPEEPTEEDSASSSSTAAAVAAATAAASAAAAALDPVAEATARARAAAAAAVAASDPAMQARRLAASLGLAAAPPAPAVAAVGAEVSAADALRQAKLIAQQFSGSSSKDAAAVQHYEEIVVINDYPQPARWKVTQKESISQVAEQFRVAVVTRGIYIAGGKPPLAGEEKLHLRIEGTHHQSVQNAKAEIKRMLEEETLRTAGSGHSGKYRVV